MRERIIQTSLQEFIKHGFKTVTTDDLAQSIGISKKTLYEYFPSKKELIQACLDSVSQDIESTDYVGDTDNVIVHFWNTFEKIIDQHKISNRRCYWELEKYFPKMATDLKNKLHEIQTNTLRRFIQRGQEQGIFRTDIDINFMTYFYLGLNKTRTDPEVYPEELYSFPYLMRKHLEIFISLIANEKGLTILKEIINK